VSVVDTVVDGRVGRVFLNRPEQLNAITIELGRQLEDAIRTLGTRPDVCVVVVRGRGGNFCVGGDFGEVERLRESGPAALQPLFDNFGAACAAISEVEVPVIAVVEGYAMAGGFEFMQAADIVLVRNDAKIADNHSNFGQVPGGGGSQRLPRLVGRQRALGHILSGDRLSGRDAVEWGIAYRGFDPDEFDSGVDGFVRRLTEKRRDALVGIKRLVCDGSATSLSEGLAMEREAVVAHISGEAGGSGVSSFNSR
jgi:enoyl-CoA hydratase/carnithine racemase